MNPLDSLNSLPPMAQSLLGLGRQDRQERMNLNSMLSGQLMDMSREKLVDPVFAGMAGLATAPEQTMWGAAGKAAVEAAGVNAKNSQDLKKAALATAFKPEPNDPLEKIGPSMLRQSSTRSSIMGKLPNGNEFIKSGDRVYEILPNKDAPEGYELKEIISSGKQILGADTVIKEARQELDNLFKVLESGGAFEGWKAPEIDLWQAETFRTILSRLSQKPGNVAGITQPLSPTTTPTPTSPGAPSAAPLAATRPAPGAPGAPASAPATTRTTDPAFPKMAVDDQGAMAIKQKELDDLLVQRDSMAVNDPRRAEVNRNISLLRQETPQLVVKSGRELANSKGYGAEEGATQMKERKGYSDLSTASGKMENQLTLLKQLYASNSDIASGKVAPIFQGLKSGLSGLGINVGKSAGIEDMIQSLSVNMALHTRTADGQNLLPGAMSNYEDQLLQSMQPGLSATREGRMLMIDFMVEIARANKRMAGYATEYEKKNGRLDVKWNAHRDQKAKEEMARLSLLQRKIMRQHGVAP